MRSLSQQFRSCAASVLFVILLSGFGGLGSLFAPKAELWDHWSAHDEASTLSVDHAAWDSFLKKYVTSDASGLNRVAYGAVTPADRAALDTYLAMRASTPVGKLSRAEQQAYWINLYNALVVRLVLDHKPETSIQNVNISSGLFSSGPWSAELIEVEGEGLSLNDIEHRILRPIWKDARLHYAVNCASVGCPNLQRAAFTPQNMDALLDAAATAYVNSPRGVRVTPEGLVVSKIYAWFTEDFGGTEESVIAHLRKFAAPALAKRLANITTIAGSEYDWNLNSAVP